MDYNLIRPLTELFRRKAFDDRQDSMKHDIFISYRRDGGEHLAGRIREGLKARGFSTFMDVEDLKSGKFDEALFQKIEEATDVLVIMTPGCLDRCVNEGDWLRLEIKHAIKSRRNIVPIIARGFEMPLESELPADISELVRYNGLAPAPEMFEASIDRLVATFLKSEGETQSSSPGLSSSAIKDAKAQVAREYADNTDTVEGIVGEGIATALVDSICSHGSRNLAAGAKPMAMGRGIQKAIDVAVEELETMGRVTQDRDGLIEVASLAAEGKSWIGALIADAMEKVGVDGCIVVRDGLSCEVELDIVEGIEFDRGYLSPHFVTNDKTGKADFKDAYVLTYSGIIGDPTLPLPILEKVSKSGLPLLLIAQDVQGKTLATLVEKYRGGLVAVNAPWFGERRIHILEDIATLTGGKCIDENSETNFEELELNDLGKAESIVVSRYSTTIIGAGGKKADIKSRIAQIRNEIETTTSNYDRQKLQERLVNVAGGVAVINVGGTSVGEAEKIKVLIDSALLAARASVIGGMDTLVAASYTALLRTRPAVEVIKVSNRDETKGVDLVKCALGVPIRQLALGQHAEGDEALQLILEMPYEKRREFSEYLQKSSMIDPKKMVSLAVQRAGAHAIDVLTQ